MSTVKEIRALCRRRGPAVKWTDVHVSVDEFVARDWIEWAACLGRDAHPHGTGFGMFMGGNRPKVVSMAEYERQDLPLMACLNCDDPDDAKTHKVVEFFQELAPAYYRGIEKDLEGRRLVTAHAAYLPIVQTSALIYDKESSRDPSKQIPIYAVTEQDVLEDCRGTDQQQDKLEELRAKRAWYEAACANTSNADLQKRLADALAAWQRAGNLRHDGHLAQTAALAKMNSWRLGVLRAARKAKRPKTPARKPPVHRPARKAA